MPIIVDRYGGKFYSVEIDSTGKNDDSTAKHVIRLFRNDDGAWREIGWSEFPKDLAAQNVPYGVTDDIPPMDPSDPAFRNGDVGRLWVLLETGKQDDRMYVRDEQPQSFYSDFRRRHIGGQPTARPRAR